MNESIRHEKFYDLKKEVQKKVTRKFIPSKLRIRALMDSSTLIRIFKGSWKTSEFKLYQNIFDIIVSETVYKEFLNFQNDRAISVKVKDSFLQLLGAEILISGVLSSLAHDFDKQIVQEAVREQIDVIITDNVRHFREPCKRNGVNCLNGRKIARIFSKI